MRNLAARLLVTIGAVATFTIFLDAGTVNGQTFPDGLIGLSSERPGALYMIDELTGEAAHLMDTETETSIVGLAYLGEALYGSDMCTGPCLTTVLILPDGSVSILSNQNGSDDWWALAGNNTDNVLYTIDIDNSLILTVQHPDGSVETIGAGTGVMASGMDYDDTNGILYAADEIYLYTVSTTDGTATPVGALGLEITGGFALGLAYDECAGVLYMNDGLTRSLYTVNVDNGAATLVGSNALEDIVDGLAWKGRCEPPPLPKQIPTMSEWGLMIMAGFIGAAGMLAFRKRRFAA
jgi:hypothetical protein